MQGLEIAALATRLRGVAGPLALASALTLGGGAAATAAPAPADLDFTLGSWHGVRRDAADGSAAPLTVRVESILGGAGFTESLEVRDAGGVYRGFATRVFDPGPGRWVQMYVNAPRRVFVRLEAEAVEGGLEWHTTADDGPRRTRVLWEHPAPDRWRRTSRVSTDAGRSWRVLYVDELTRDRTAAPDGT